MIIRLFEWLRTLWLLTVLLFSAGCGGGGESIQQPAPSTPVIALERAFAKLNFVLPVDLQQAPADDSRWFLIERGGRIAVFSNDEATTTTSQFIDLEDRVVSMFGEDGLLGIAFHPQFASNGQVFLSYTAAPAAPGAALESRISRFQSTDGGLTLEPTSEQVLLRLDQPFSNHNGGNIAFGPDGFLYVGFGDGGSGGDPLGNAQDLNTLLGAMLRLDIDGSTPYAIPADNPFASGGGRPEIFATGLRNPWRWSFDRITGKLWLGDVGQDVWEEVDQIVAGGNYGWNTREGAHCFPVDPCDPTGLMDPVAEYSHLEGCSITGGFVYRGSAIPELFGYYLYADFCSGIIWGFPAEGSGPKLPQVLIKSGRRISSFGEGNNGELYLLDYTNGEIQRIIGTSTP